MALSVFERLPAEVVWAICDHVRATSPRSLRACSQASKQCRSLTAGLVFRSVKITIAETSLLGEEVQRCATALESSSSTKHVHRLTVDGMRPCDPDETYFLPDDSQPTPTVEDMNESWTPFAALVKRLPALTDLVWLCPTQVPPCVLETLHAGKSQCRLHVQDFVFQSLEYPKIDDYELALATSPCLYSVATSYDPSSQEDSERSDDVFMKFASGLAPNLRELRLTVGNDKHLYRDHYDLELADAASWWRLPSDGSGPHRGSGSLRLFKYRSFEMVGYQYLRKWFESVDLAHLKTLKIWCCLEDEAVEYLGDCQTLSSLEHLSLMLSPLPGLKARYRDPTTIPKPYTEGELRRIQNFVRQTMPLSSLALGGLGVRHPGLGYLGDVLQSNKGESLKSLSVCRWMWYSDDHYETASQLVLGVEEICSLQRDCPNLEDLKLSIRRTRGDHNEVEKYKLIGKFSYLRTLCIILDASAIRANFDVSLYEEWERKLWEPQSYCRGAVFQGQVSDSLINNALDEHLARQIFHTVESGKLRVPNARPLERLTLHVDSSLDFGRGYGHPQMSLAPWSGTGIANLAEVARIIGQSRVVTAESPWPMSSVGEHSDTHLDVQQIPIRWPSDAYARDYDWMDMSLTNIFRRLWPESSGDWRNDWHSFPLAKLKNDEGEVDGSGSAPR